MSETITVWHDRRIYRVDARLTKKEARRLLEGGAPMLIRPIEGQRPCPFEAGERLEIAPNHLWIEIVRTKAKAGEWRIEYRIIDFRPNLLGNKAGTTSDPRRAIKTVDIDEDGTRRKEPEYVEDGWHDVGKAKREEMRIESRKQIEVERKLQAAKSRLNRLLRGLDAPAQKAMLAEIERLCDQVEQRESEVLKDAA